MGQRLGHQPRTPPATPSPDSLSQPGGRDAASEMDDLVSQDDELVEVQRLGRREIAPGVFAADDPDPPACFDVSGLKAVVSPAAEASNPRLGRAGHDVQRFGGRPATGER